VRISFGGSLSKEVCSRSSPSLTPWLARKVVASFRIVCVGLRLLRCRVFFFFFFFGLGGPGKIITVVNLRKIHVIIMDRCFLCKRNE